MTKQLIVAVAAEKVGALPHQRYQLLEGLSSGSSDCYCFGCFRFIPASDSLTTVRSLIIRVLAVSYVSTRSVGVIPLKHSQDIFEDLSPWNPFGTSHAAPCAPAILQEAG